MDPQGRDAGVYTINKRGRHGGHDKDTLSQQGLQGKKRNIRKGQI